MTRLDVYPMPGKRRGGYVVDVQAELLSKLATRMVIPLIPVSDAPPPISELNPVIDIKGAPHVLLTQALASVPLSELRKPVCSIDHHHDAITRALDVLFVGF
ncbi:CcdB-like protein [Ameyamaea chiangmaiensis NBRC 103196]|uniref:Toxin CcdB n=1 Tax=Ameyamaea chiangmaiensis TaxID=442969 RepID=A0A850PAN7_9PROT|nr:CcdB family protein [Ameyamaea chiangmaiensis]NVN39600.1 CcdB family protein [Ameyamaea chiangmaiensis]GBQ64255.1 CcdB-like protein [Ameyamaea chiangmaiensis NBRC 103196]